jgi:hypothetical protein
MSRPPPRTQTGNPQMPNPKFKYRVFVLHRFHLYGLTREDCWNEIQSFVRSEGYRNPLAVNDISVTTVGEAEPASAEPTYNLEYTKLIQCETEEEDATKAIGYFLMYYAPRGVNLYEIQVEDAEPAEVEQLP